MDNFLNLTVNDLLSEKVPPAFEDKVFWFASRVQMRENTLRIEIDNDKGLTAFRPLCEQLDITCLETLAELRPTVDWSNGFGPVLVSSGSFLFINGKLAVTRRSADATVDPNLWTTPAGRCDRTPLETALKETIEEIKIYDNNGNWLIPSATVPFVDSSSRPIAFPTIEEDSNLPVMRQIVNCYLDGEYIETSYMWVYYSSSVNTVELRLPLFASIDTPILLHNEEYRTETKMLNPVDINKEEVVPALKKLLEEIYG